MISKELLGEVLMSDKILNINDYDNDIQIVYTDGLELLNIYELAHKCKDFAMKQGYDIFSGFHRSLNSYIAYVYKKDDISWEEWVVSPRADTEPEAIFKACEWILENKGVLNGNR